VVQVATNSGRMIAKNWSSRHDQVVLLRAAGHQNVEIAERSGYDQAYISRILKDPRAETRLAELTKRIADNSVDIALKLKLYANEALETAVHWMRQREDKLAQVSARSAFEILDRAGYTRVEKHIVANLDIGIDQLDRMAELAASANEVVETYDYSEVKADG